MIGANLRKATRLGERVHTHPANTPPIAGRVLENTCEAPRTKSPKFAQASPFNSQIKHNLRKQYTVIQLIG